MKNKRKKVVTLYLIRLHWELKMLSFGNTNTRRTGSKKKPDDLSQLKRIRCAKSFHSACCSEFHSSYTNFKTGRMQYFPSAGSKGNWSSWFALGILLYLLWFRQRSTRIINFEKPKPPFFSAIIK